MVPTKTPKEQFSLLSTSATTRSTSSRVITNSAAAATNGIMISTRGSLPFARRAQAASQIART